MSHETREPGRTPENEAFYGGDAQPAFDPQHSLEQTAALAAEYADIYQADDIAFQMGMTTKEARLGPLSRIFEVSSRYGEFARGSLEFYSGITRAKEARTIMRNPDEYDTYAGQAFAGLLDENPFTPRLLGDVIASRLQNPMTPSSTSVQTVIEQVQTEIGDIPQGTRITMPLVIGRIVTGQMKMSPLPTTK